MAIDGNWLSTHMHLVVGNSIFGLDNFCDSDRQNETSSKSEISVVSVLPRSQDENSLHTKMQKSFQCSKRSDVNHNSKSCEALSGSFSYELARIKSEMCLKEDMLNPLSPLPPTPPPDSVSSVDAFFDRYIYDDYDEFISQGVNKSSYFEGVLFSDTCNEHIQNTSAYTSESCEGPVPLHEMCNEPPEPTLPAFDGFMGSGAYYHKLAGSSQQFSMHSEKTKKFTQGEDERAFNVLEPDYFFSATLDYDDETQTSSLCIDLVRNVSFSFEVHDDGTVQCNWPGTKHGTDKSFHSVSSCEKLDQPSRNSFLGCDNVMDCGVYSDNSPEDSQQLRSYLDKTKTSHGEIKPVSTIHKKYSKLFVATLDCDSEVQAPSLCIEAVNKVPISFEAHDDGTLHFSWSDPQYNESTNNSLYGRCFSTGTGEKGSKTNSVLKCTVSPGDSVMLNRLPLKTYVEQWEANKSSLITEPNICKVSHSSRKIFNKMTNEKKTLEYSKQHNKISEADSVSRKLSDDMQSEKQHSVDLVQVVTQAVSNLCDGQQYPEKLFIADNKPLSSNKSINETKIYSDVTEFSTDALQRSSNSTSKQNVLQDDQQLHSLPNISTANSVIPSGGPNRLTVGMQVSECNKEHHRPESVSCESYMNMHQHKGPLYTGSLSIGTSQITCQKTSNVQQKSSEQPLVTENRSTLIDEQLSSIMESLYKITDVSDVLETNSPFPEQNRPQDDLCFKNPEKCGIDSVLSSIEQYCLKGEKQILKCSTDDYGNKSTSCELTKNVQPDELRYINSSKVTSLETNNVDDKQKYSVHQTTTKNALPFGDGELTSLQQVTSKNVSSGTSATKELSHVSDYSYDVHEIDCVLVEQNVQQKWNLPLHSSFTQMVEYSTKDAGNKSTSYELIKNVQPKGIPCINSSQVKFYEASNVDDEQQLSVSQPFTKKANDELTSETQNPPVVTEFDGYEANPIFLEKDVQENGKCFQNLPEVYVDNSYSQNDDCCTLKEEMKALECNKEETGEKLTSQKSNKDLISEQTSGLGLLQTTYQETNNLCNKKKPLEDQLRSDGESSFGEQERNTRLLYKNSKKEMLSEKPCVTYSLQHMSEKTNNLFDHHQSSGKPHHKNGTSFAESKKQSAVGEGSQVTECSAGVHDRKKKSNEKKYSHYPEISQKSRQKVLCDKLNSPSSPQLNDELHDIQKLSGHFLGVKASLLFVGNKNSDTAKQKLDVAECGVNIFETDSTTMKQNMHRGKQCTVDIYPSRSEVKLKRKVKPLSAEDCHESSSLAGDDISCENPRKKQKYDGTKYKHCSEQQNGSTLLSTKSNKNMQCEMSNSTKTLHLMYEKMMTLELLDIVNPGLSCDDVKGGITTEGEYKMTDKNCLPRSDKFLQTNADQNSSFAVISPNSTMKMKSSATAVKKKEESGTNVHDNVTSSSSGDNCSCEKVKVKKLYGKKHKQNLTNQEISQEVNISSPCKKSAMKHTVSAAVSKTGNCRTVDDFSVKPGKLHAVQKETVDLDECIIKSSEPVEKLNVTVNCAPSDRDESETVVKKKKRKKKEQVMDSYEIISQHGNLGHLNSPNSNSGEKRVFKNLTEKHSLFERSWRNHFFHLGQKNLECNAGLQKCLMRLEKANETHKRFHKVLTNQFIATILNPQVVSNVKQGVSTIISHFCSSTADPLQNVMAENGRINLPLMSPSEQYIVNSLFDAQNKGKPHLLGVIPAILSMILGQFSQSSKLQLFGFGALCRLYTAIYKKLDFLPGPQLLCRDILIKCRRKAPYLIASIAGVWPKVLEFRDIIQGVHNPLNLAISYLLLQPCGGHFQNMSARDLNAFTSLTRLDFCVTSSLTPAELVEKIFKDFTCCDESGLLTEDVVTYYTKAVELICERHTWKWAVEVIVIENIHPFLDRWIKKCQTSHHVTNSVAVTAVFRLLGWICHRVSAHDKNAILSVMKKLETLLTDTGEKGIPFIVQEAAFVTLISLKSEGKDLKVPSVQSWAQKNLELLSTDAKKLLKALLLFPQQSEGICSRHFGLDTCAHCLKSSWWSHYCAP